MAGAGLKVTNNVAELPCTDITGHEQTKNGHQGKRK